MTPKKPETELELFQSHLDQILDREHSLYKLSYQIEWKVFEDAFGVLYSPGQGRPGLPIRLMVGLALSQARLRRERRVGGGAVC